MPAPKDPEKRKQWLENLSKSHTGLTYPDKKLSPEHRKNLSKAKQGTHHTPLQTERQSAAQMGRIVSEETIEKIKTSNTGKTRSQETKDRISEAGIRRFSSAEEREKQAQRTKDHYANMSEEEKAISNERRLRHIKYQDTDLEKFVEKMLIERGIIYEHPKQIGRYRVDYYIPKNNTIIEVNGCWWHCCEECWNDQSEYAISKRNAEKERTQRLESLGYVVKIFWQHDIVKLMKD